MKISEDEARKFLERLFPLQETEQQLLCPRCGRNELYSGLYFFLNSLSRYAQTVQEKIQPGVFFPEQFEQIRSCIYLRKVLDG